MGKLIQFVHMTLDGFVSTPDGGLGWVNFEDPAIFETAGEICDAANLVVYGRGTYDIMDAYWPTAADKPGATAHDISHAAWYKKIDKIVLSKTITDDPSKKMRVMNDHLREQITSLKSGADANLLLMGSPTAGKALAKLDLIDEYWLFLYPVILGTGKRMFEEQLNQHKLVLIKQRVFTNGVVALQYAVVR